MLVLKKCHWIEKEKKNQYKTESQNLILTKRRDIEVLLFIWFLNAIFVTVLLGN